MKDLTLIYCPIHLAEFGVQNEIVNKSTGKPEDEQINEGRILYARFTYATRKFKRVQCMPEGIRRL